MKTKTEMTKRTVPCNTYQSENWNQSLSLATMVECILPQPLKLFWTWFIAHLPYGLGSILFLSYHIQSSWNTSSSTFSISQAEFVSLSPYWFAVTTAPTLICTLKFVNHVKATTTVRASFHSKRGNYFLYFAKRKLCWASFFSYMVCLVSWYTCTAHRHADAPHSCSFGLVWLGHVCTNPPDFLTTALPPTDWLTILPSLWYQCMHGMHCMHACVYVCIREHEW